MYYEDINAGSYRTKDCYVIVRDANSSVNLRGYKHHFIWKYSPTKSEMFAIAEWCDEYCEGDWLVGISTSGFKREIDAMAFKLRWME